MASFTMSDSPVFDAIPAGAILEAKVIDCKLQESPFWLDKDDHSKGKQEQVSFRFKVTQPVLRYTMNGEDVDMDVKDRQLFGNTPTTFTNHPDCKLRAWVQEILGVTTLPADFTFDTDDLLDAPCKIIVGNYDKKAADGSIVVKDTVKDVMRLEESGFDYEDF